MKRVPWEKRKFAIGIQSKVPGSIDSHYALFDIDNKDKIKDFMYWLEANKCNYIVWESARGIHAIDLTPMPFKFALLLIRSCPFVDQKWIEIGEKRGHLFLAESQFISIKNVTYMHLRRKK